MVSRSSWASNKDDISIPAFCVDCKSFIMWRGYLFFFLFRWAEWFFFLSRLYDTLSAVSISKKGSTGDHFSSRSYEVFAKSILFLEKQRPTGGCACVCACVCHYLFCVPPAPFSGFISGLLLFFQCKKRKPTSPNQRRVWKELLFPPQLEQVMCVNPLKGICFWDV